MSDEPVSESRMMRRLLLSFVPVALLLPLLFKGLDGPLMPARDHPQVDVAMVTAIDLSDSIMRHHEWLQFEGIARAILDPDFLAAIARGPRGRISFAAFTWSGDGQQQLIVPWTLIDGRNSALEVAARIRRAPRPVRFGAKASGVPSPERRTDLSAAINHGVALLAGTRRANQRQVLNVIGNGGDNVAGGVRSARDGALAAGITINGVVLGGDPTLATYFRERVVGGAGSFVMRVAEPAAFADVMRAKFLRDLIAETSPPAVGGPT